MTQAREHHTIADRSSVYEGLIPQIIALLENETDLIANTANIAALIKEAFNFHWVGFYLVKNGELVLGPFQGPVACTRIAKGKGVCGSAWEKAQTLIVPDVDQFPGHIACSAFSRSEIVVPMVEENGTVLGVLDIDSAQLDDFSETDRGNLERVVEELMKTQVHAA